MEDERSGSGHWELEQDENVPVLLRAKDSLGLRAFGVLLFRILSGPSAFRRNPHGEGAETT